MRTLPILMQNHVINCVLHTKKYSIFILKRESCAMLHPDNQKTKLSSDGHVFLDFPLVLLGLFIRFFKQVNQNDVCLMRLCLF